jgi:nicotinamide phosphoribosyltransferase
MDGVDGVVVFGMQYFLQRYLIEEFRDGFFHRPKEEVLDELKEFFDSYFGPDSVDVSRFGDLHDLGYLPLKIKCLPEGDVCPIGVPFITIVNTHPKFYWLTNFIETLMQTVLWNFVTSATIARRFKKLLTSYAEKTGASLDFVPFQAHNFSMRGMSSVESGMSSDAGHLTSFVGSDTLPGNVLARKYYDASGLVSCSVPATEHAVMCAGGMGDERETFRRLIQDIYPSGIVSIVSDTWDLWNVLTNIAPSLRSEIEARDGKVVFRPDSGDPVKIVCGYTALKVDETYDEVVKMNAGKYLMNFFNEVGNDAIETSDGVFLDAGKKRLPENEMKGCVRILDEQFGSTVNAAGYKELNPKVGLIYGDGITLSRCEQICRELEALGYASSNIVFGVGSYTYQYVTRDTFSIACKATWVQINGEAYDIFKDPVTDDGTKKSACGLLCVSGESGAYKMADRVSPEEESETKLEPVFEDGDMLKRENLQAIRDRLCGAMAHA